MRQLKKYTLVLALFIIAGFTVQENSVEGLTIQFRKISESSFIPGEPNGTIAVFPEEASEGMKFVKLKLTLKNNGTKDCIFDFSDVYISNEQDTLYRFLKFQGYFTSTKTKIKPKKEIDRIILFEFPETSKPKELFIENKRYPIIKTEK